jgi:glycosyltransferase involved in cell wall biosynthesis
LIYSSHNVEYQKYREQGKSDIRRGVLAPYVYWAERAACRAARLVVAISASDRTEYAKWVEPEKIEVIPQGFDAEAWNPFTRLRRRLLRLFCFSETFVSSTIAGRRGPS